MTCRAYRSRQQELEDYLEGRLEGAARRTVAAHLDQCALCREAVEDGALAGRLLRGAIAPAGDVSEAYWTRLGAGLRAEQARRLALGDFGRLLEAWCLRFSFSAVVLVAGLIGFLVGSALQAPGARPGQPAEVREIFQEPEQQPTTGDEVLASVVTRGR